MPLTRHLIETIPPWEEAARARKEKVVPMKPRVAEAEDLEALGQLGLRADVGPAEVHVGKPTGRLGELGGSPHGRYRERQSVLSATRSP